MSKLLQGNTLSHDNASPLWLSSDSPEAFKKNSIESGFRERWENIKITYDLNEEGYRAKQWSEIDWSESIAMIGDSHTLGLGVPYGHTVTKQLSRRLSREVVNLGVGGCSNLFMLYNAANVLEHFNPWGMIIQWSAAERFPRFSHPNPGNSGVQHFGSWNLDNIYYKRLWVKEDNFLFHDKFIKQTARQLNINRFLDYVPEAWKNEYDTDDTLVWRGDSGENYARDNIHPDVVIYKKWTEIIYQDIIKNGWLD